MDTGKTYHDTEGNECSIWQMVKREPEWAANRIQDGEYAIAEVDRLRAENERLRNALCEALDHGDYFSKALDDWAAVLAPHEEEKCDRLYELRKILPNASHQTAGGTSADEQDQH